MEPNKLTVQGYQIVGVLDPCHNSVGIHNYMGMWHACGNLFAFHIKSWLQSRSLQPLQEIPKQNPPSPIQVTPKNRNSIVREHFWPAAVIGRWDGDVLAFGGEQFPVQKSAAIVAAADPSQM